MALVNLALKHGTSLDEAKARLRQTVDDLRSRATMFFQQATWSEGGSTVNLTGPGFVMSARVDSESVHVEGDIPLLAKLIASPIMAHLKQVLEKNFQKKLE